MKSKKISILIASDHAGFEMKKFFLSQKQIGLYHITWKDLGPKSKARTDYPDFAQKLAREIQEDPNKRGLLICGSGVGMCIAANRFKGVRAVLVENETLARLSRMHNDSNVLCLGSRLTANELGVDLLTTWLATSFEGGRHQGRVKKIDSAN